MKKWLMVLVPLLILGYLIFWRLQQKNAEFATQSMQRSGRTKAPVSVELTSPQLRTIESSFEATGSVEAIQNVKISPKVTGRIEELIVHEGDRVHQGQVLVRIDQSDVMAQVRQQKAALAEAEYRLAQAELTTSTTDTSVSTQIRQQQANLASAEAELHQAEQTHSAQYDAAKSSIEDAQGKIESATAQVANANAAIKSAQANWENASTKYDRTYNLYKQGYVAAQDVDDAKAALSVQDANVTMAKGQLQSATAVLNSAQAQKRSAEQQANITRAKADADLEAARAKVSQARAQLDMAKANSQQSPAYRQSIEALRAGVAAAKASLDSANAKCADTILRSPLDGVVTARNLDPGSLATSGQPILTIQALKKVWVTVAVPEDVCAKIHLNDQVTVAFDALDGRKFTANIAQINPAADTASRQFTVRVILDNAHNDLKAGMFGRVAFVTGKAIDALAVPREAIKQDDDGNNYVIMESTKHLAEYRTVTTGMSDDEWVEVTSGLTHADKVVTMSASNVREGQMLGRGKGRGGKGGHGRRGGEAPSAGARAHGTSRAQ